MSRAPRRPALFALVAAVAGTVATIGQPGGRPPDVVLVVVDTLRADRLGVYGNERGLTPFLDGLARRSIVFANAYATTTWTNPSIASLFTSRYASELRVTGFDSKVPSDAVTLAEALHRHGYVTAGFCGNDRLTAQLGFAQGFDVWLAPQLLRKIDGSHLTRKSVQALDRLRRARPGAPLFLYVHYMDPHSPYEPPPPYRARFARPGPDAAAANAKVQHWDWGSISEAEVDVLSSLYDGEVAYVDAALAHLFAELAARRILDEAVVIVTADHGEEFREHGFLSHGANLYNTTLHVPAMMLAPGYAARSVADGVSLLDLGPTVLDLLHLPPEPTFEGRSLVPMLAGRSEPRDVLAELAKSNVLTQHASALVRDGVKVMARRQPQWMVGRVEVYDLAHDPGETSPLPSERFPALLRRLRAQKSALATRALLPGERAPLDEEQRRKLRALGYVN